MGRKRNKFDLKWLAIAGISVFAVAGIVLAYQGGIPKVVVEGDYIEAPDAKDVADSEFTLGFSTDYCDGTEAVTNMCVTDIHSSYDGFVVSGSLTNATGTATSTRLFYEQNDTGNDWLCDQVVLDITTGDWHALQFSVSTSTYVGTSFVADGAGTLIASTTLATSTTDIFSKEDDEGTDTREIWQWNDDIYISGLMGPISTGNTASSTDYDNIDGRYYVHCWIKAD
jgi:hypothetical protein